MQEGTTQRSTLKAVAIVNPMAQGGRAGERWPTIEAALRVHFPALQSRLTEARGHATKLSRRALEDGAELIISVGGDGTNNEVLSGFIDDAGSNRFPDASLGLIAAGTGGDFQRMFGSSRIEKQVRRLVESPPREVDYGIARFLDHEGNECLRPFLNVSSVGISGQVAHLVNQSDKRFGPR